MDPSTPEYYVDYSEYSYTIRDPADDEWDNGDYGLDVSLSSLRRSNYGGRYVERLYDDIYGFDNIEPGQPAYVVLVQYTTGDTFGSHGAWCVPAIKADYREALEVVKKCEGENRSTKAFRPWDGYFEHLDSVYVETLLVGP